MSDVTSATAPSDRVYKICPRGAWERALATGSLELSRDDARDGYVHLSTAAQLTGTLERHYAGQRDLVLLELVVSSLPPGALRWEASRGGQLFPHLYAPLEVALVARALELPVGADGTARLPALPLGTES